MLKHQYMITCEHPKCHYYFVSIDFASLRQFRNASRAEGWIRNNIETNSGSRVKYTIRDICPGHAHLYVEETSNVP